VSSVRLASHQSELASSSSSHLHRSNQQVVKHNWTFLEGGLAGLQKTGGEGSQTIPSGDQFVLKFPKVVAEIYLDFLTRGGISVVSGGGRVRGEDL